MGQFNWDGETYTEGDSNGEFIKEDEWIKLYALDATIYIVSIGEGVSNYEPNKPKEQWLVNFLTPTGEEKTKGLTKGNAERDARIIRFRNTLAASEEPIAASITKVGKRYDFVAPKDGS